METKYGNDIEALKYLSGEKVLDIALYEGRLKTEKNSMYWILFPLVYNEGRLQYIGKSIIFLTFRQLKNFCKDLKVKVFAIDGNNNQRVSR